MYTLNLELVQLFQLEILDRSCFPLSADQKTRLEEKTESLNCFTNLNCDSEAKVHEKR